MIEVVDELLNDESALEEIACDTIKEITGNPSVLELRDFKTIVMEKFKNLNGVKEPNDSQIEDAVGNVFGKKSSPINVEDVVALYKKMLTECKNQIS